MQWKSSHRVLVIMAVALFFATLLVASIAFKPSPILIWNASDSVPIGLYFVSNRQPNIGQIAVIEPPDWVGFYAASRGYLPANVWLLKPVFAVRGSIICRHGSFIFVDGKLVARAKIFDRDNQLLPVWKGCRALKIDELFVLAKPKLSFDSRYFGPINRKAVIGTAVRITFN